MMPQDDQHFTPDDVDEQIDWLERAAHAQPPTPNTRVIQGLHRLYENEQADAQSVDAVWQRLQERGAVPALQPQRARRSGPPRQHDSGPPPPSYPSAAPARRGLSTRLLAIAAAVLLVVVVSGLVAGLVLVRQHGPVVSNRPTAKPGQTAAPGSSTATPTLPPCATRPTATAEAWFPNPTPGTPGPNWIRGQITGTINNGPVQTLSNFHYPLGIPPESQSYVVSPFFMAWSPDAHYLAVGVNEPYTPPVYAYVVDTTTHVVTPISIPKQDTGEPWPGWVGGRLFAWADTHTLLLFYGGNTAAQGSAGPTLSYDVLTQKLTPLPQIRAVEGVVRCSTLFYLELTVSSNQSGNIVGDALLHRYDLETHSEVGQPILLSATYANAINPASHLAPDTSVPVWDVSPDGTRLVYQQEELNSYGNLTKQQFWVANSDGTNAMPLFSPAQPSDPSSFVKIAPNGQFVVISGLLITSMSITGESVRSYGNKTAGNYGGYPTWLPDSSGFDVVNTVPSQQSFSAPFVSRYLLSTPPNSDGYVPGTTQVPDAQTLAGLP